MTWFNAWYCLLNSCRCDVKCSINVKRSITDTTTSSQYSGATYQTEIPVACGQKNSETPTPATSAHWSISQTTEVSRASFNMRAVPLMKVGADAVRGSVRVISAVLIGQTGGAGKSRTESAS